MINAVVTTLGLAAALLPVGAATAPQTKPAPPPGGTVIVKVLPGVLPSNLKADGNYMIDGDTSTQNADAAFKEMKKVLDERFKLMFELKFNLDKNQAHMSAKWEEYHTMNQAYNAELKKLVADWVTDHLYNK